MHVVLLGRFMAALAPRHSRNIRVKWEKYAVQNLKAASCVSHRRGLQWMRNEVSSVPANTAVGIIQCAGK